MKNNSLSIKYAFVTAIILLVNLVFLFYLKYSKHGLLFSDFSLNKIGNLLNFGIFIITAVGLLVLYFRKVKIATKSIFLSSLLLNLFLIGIVLFNLLKIPYKEYLLFNFSFTQIVEIILFSFFQFTQIFLMLFIWLKIFKIDNLLLLRALVNSFFIALGLLLFALIFINSGRLLQIGTITGKTKYDVAVVLGAAVWSDNRPSPSLANRVDKAAELYNKGLAGKIQLTGGNAPGELSEAEVSLNHILKKGIDRKDIWIEKNTTSTIEQVRFIKKELIQDKKFNSVVIVSDIYHLQRVKEICRFYNIKADVSASDLKLKTDKIIFYQLRECVALLLFWLFAL